MWSWTNGLRSKRQGRPSLHRHRQSQVRDTKCWMEVQLVVCRRMTPSHPLSLLPTHSHPPPSSPAPPHSLPGKLPVNIANLRRAWESSQRVTKDDWAEWMRNFSVELLRQSPSPALRACCELAQVRVGGGGAGVNV